MTPLSSLLSSSSLRTASWMWRGIILVFLLSRAAFPASSRISAARYSRTAHFELCQAPASTVHDATPGQSFTTAYKPSGNKTLPKERSEVGHLLRGTRVHQHRYGLRTAGEERGCGREIQSTTKFKIDALVYAGASGMSITRQKERAIHLALLQVSGDTTDGELQRTDTLVTWVVVKMLLPTTDIPS